MASEEELNRQDQLNEKLKQQVGINEDIFDLNQNIGNDILNQIKGLENQLQTKRDIRKLSSEANRLANWNFEFDWIESLQFTKYAKNQFYTWHTDAFPDSYKSSSSTHNNKIRKLSFTCQLSDPNDYEGGELEFVIPQTFKHELKFSAYKLKEIIPQGSLVVFPSFLLHRVKPVTKGVRYSLVSWALGFPFK